MNGGLSGRGWPQTLLAACALFAASLAIADIAIPPLKSRITDLTSTLSGDQRAALERTLAAFEARKGSQIAVLMVPTTQPETVEQYAVRVEETWKLGRKGIDDGVLMVVAKDDRKLWIEVGYGLEGVLNDATAKRLIEEEIVPRFKQGDFYGGINAGVERIIKVVDGEPLPPPKGRRPQTGGTDFETLLIFGFILVFVVGGILRAIFGRFIGAGIISAVAGFLAWTMAGTLLVAIIVAIIAFGFSLLGGTRGGWSSGGGFSGGGGFGGGGGFSGGGGGSGGGGAGGSW
ncbi:MAG: YgcG family protein [Betaproteobacteria bacterium]|nr:YgcG family protein [Betaproteobacteria bacterium]